MIITEKQKKRHNFLRDRYDTVTIIDQSDDFMICLVNGAHIDVYEDEYANESLPTPTHQVPVTSKCIDVHELLEIVSKLTTGNEYAMNEGLLIHSVNRSESGIHASTQVSNSVLEAVRRCTGKTCVYADEYVWADLPDSPTGYYNMQAYRIPVPAIARGCQVIPYEYAKNNTTDFLDGLMQSEHPTVPQRWLSHKQIEATGQWERVAIDVDGHPTDIPKDHIARRLTWTHDIYKYIG